MKKEQKNELMGVIVILLGIYLALSVFTYQSVKNPLTTSHIGNVSLIGQIGTVIAFFIKLGIGWSAYILPFLILYLGIRIFMGKYRGWVEIFIFLLLTISFSFLFAIIKTTSTLKGGDLITEPYLFSAGYIGYFLGHYSLRLLGKAGSIIFTVILFFISLFTLTDILFKSVILSIKNMINNKLILIKKHEGEKKIEKKIKEKTKRIKTKEKRLKKHKKEKKNKKKENIMVPKQPIVNKIFSEITNPPLNILETSTKGNLKEDNLLLEEQGKHLVDKLKLLNINATLTSFVRGPTVTRYEIKLDAAQRISQVASMSNDIAYALAKSPVRIIAPIPGKQAVGIEIPNENKRVISLSEILHSREFSANKRDLKIGIGCTIDGTYVIANLNEMPHLLIAGSTGSGKSVMIKAIIDFLLLQYSPNELKLLMVDPKRVELNHYKGIPHLLSDIIVEPKRATKALLDLVNRMTFRLELFSNYGSANIQDYNDYVSKNKEKDPELKYMPYIVLIVDELADLMMVSKNEVETSLARLAQLARATGIHLIIATQRPSVDVVTGIIKANFPVRIGFRVAQKVDSRTIFDKNGAEALLGKGDLLYLPPGKSNLVRAQAPLPTKKETSGIVSHWKKYSSDNFPDWELNLMRAVSEQPHKQIGSVDDDLFVEAYDYFLTVKRVSVSSLQTRFSIGFNRAARLVDKMEELGLVSIADRSKKRELLIGVDEWEELKRKF